MSNYKVRQKKTIHSAYEFATTKISFCFACNMQFQKMKLKTHITDEHKFDVEEYYLQYIDSQANKCLCGCGLVVKWVGLSFFDYIHGHNSRGKTKENSTAMATKSIKMKEHFRTGRMVTSFTKMSDEKIKNIRQKQASTMKNKVATGEYTSPSANMTPEQRSIAQRKSAKTIIEKYGSPNYGFRNIKKGSYTTKDNRVIHFDSGLELEYMKILDNHPKVVTWERPIFSIPYMFEGKEHDYYPDFLVVFKDGHLELQETKGSEIEKDFAKYSYAQKWADENRMNYVVLYRKDIETLAKDLTL